MSGNIRTDLALEARELWREHGGAGALPGVSERRESIDGFAVNSVDILDARGEAALGKPVGSYVTVELDGLFRREEDAFPRACALLSGQLRKFIKIPENGNILVVGLGNRGITPDAVGPDTVDFVLVTRHLIDQLPGDFSSFRPVTAVCAGVLGTTGIESGELVAAVARQVRPELVVAVDALASRSPDRLCRTVQLADTGIVPGSGVGNARRALNRESIGVPVLAVGVPTVVDAATLALDLASRAGATLDPDAFGSAGSMIVTPRDIDRDVRDVAKLIGYSLNMAFHPGMTVADVDMFLS